MESVNNMIDLARQLSKSTDGVELEARIKGPILRTDTVQKLLEEYKGWSKKEYTEKRSKGQKGSMGISYRSIDNGKIVCKSTIAKSKHNWYTIVLSTEEVFGVERDLVSRYYSTFTKTRHSRNMDKFTRLDVTYIHEEDTYQVEVELLKYKKDNKFLEYVEKVVSILQDSPMYISRKRFEVAREVGGKEYPFMHLTKGIYQKPVTICKRDVDNILCNGGFMTTKVDGVRRMLLFFNGMVYELDTEYLHVRLLSDNSRYVHVAPIFVDVERLDGIYYVIDFPTSSNLSILERMKEGINFVTDVYPWMDIRLKACVEIKEEDIDSIAKYSQQVISNDGIIFVEKESNYTSRVVKWKRQVTIDLLVEDGKISGVDTEVSFPDGVHEFLIEQVEGDSICLEHIRQRFDKKYPNSTKVVKANLEEGFVLRGVWDGFGCYLMRKYHNKFKSAMLRRIPNSATILDIGSGRGGDISKWKKLRKVYALEPSKRANKEFRRRLQDNPGNIQLINKKLRYLEDIEKLDAITIFFVANLLRKKDMDKLEELLVRDRCKLSMIFMDENLIRYEDCQPCYTISKSEDEKKYHIKLHGTVIDQQEYKLDIKDILEMAKRIGYRVMYEKVLIDGRIPGDDQVYRMTDVERKLSSMFHAVELG